MYEIFPMNMDAALQISKWTYEEPYVLYSFQETKDTMDEFMNYDYYFANKILEDEIFGYFCFEDAALVPASEKEIYTEDALDIGLGMNPKFCGRGMGFDFLNAGLKFAVDNKLNGRSKIRLTVADFNKRAIKLYERVGFKYITSFKYGGSLIKFNIMTLDI